MCNHTKDIITTAGNLGLKDSWIFQKSLPFPSSLYWAYMLMLFKSIAYYICYVTVCQLLYLSHFQYSQRIANCATGTFWIPYWDFLNTFFRRKWDFLNTKNFKWEKFRKSFLIEQMGLFEYFSVRLQEFSSSFFLRKRSFYRSSLESGKSKWMQMGLFEYFWNRYYW